MIWLKISILLFYTHLIYSSDVCKFQNSCKCELSSGDGIIDLTLVGSPEFPRFYDVLFENNCSSKLYSYNPCFPFDSADKHVKTEDGLKPCAGAAGCTKTPGGSEGQFPWEHAIGLQETSVFGKNETDMYINYTVPGSAKNLQVYLSCDNTSTEHLLSVIEPECSNNLIVLNLTTRCACPNLCLSSIPDTKSGLSTGSILLIVFFTFLIAYLIVGITWNFCNGAAGMELLPNLEFWNELPTLIMEGVVFSCSCFSKPNTYVDI